MYSLGIVAEAFLGIILTLDSWIYSLVSGAYKVFMAIASARLLSSDAYTEIANKVYIIIGVGMLFVLAYSILKAIIDPDQLSKGDMAGGKILKSVAYAVIGLIVTPLLFNVAYKVQNQMLEEDILGKLFFRTSDSVVSVEGVGDVNYDEMIKHTGGAVAATSVWQAFFYPADGVDPNEIYADAEIVRQTANLAAAGCAASVGVAAVGIIAGFFTAGVAWVVSGAAVLSCVNAVVQNNNADKVEEAVGDLGKFSLTQAYAMVSGGESFAIFQAFLEPVDEGEIKYVWFISTVFGAFVAYAFVTYAIDMGTRAAKLAYFQIIAPVPLILQILPKSGDKLNKFIKGIFSTFLEVFVRISIVYIIVYIVCHLNEVFSTVSSLWNSSDLSGFEILLAKALLIIGLVIFAKQAPKIISDTFGLSAGGALDGLNLMKKLRDGEVFTAGHMVGSSIKSGAQGIYSGIKHGKDTKGKVMGAVGNMLGGAVSGGVRAGYDRFKSGKPVGSYKDMKNNITSTTRAVADKRKERDEFFDQHSSNENQFLNMGEQIGAKVKDVKDSTYRWFAGDRDMSKYQSDIKFAGNLNSLLDDVRSEAEKKDNVTKMWAKREKDLQEQELSRWKTGFNEQTYYEEIKKERERDARYQTAAAAVNEVSERKAAMNQAKTDLEKARASGADATTIGNLEREFRARENAYMLIQGDEQNRLDALKVEEERIKTKVDARALLSDEEFADMTLEHQAKIKAARDKKEAAADIYVASQMADSDSIVYGKVQTFLNDNQEYMSSNSSRTIYTKLDSNGNPTGGKTINELMSNAFGDGAIKGVIDTEQIFKGDVEGQPANNIILTIKGADGNETNSVYTMKFDYDPVTKAVSERYYLDSAGNKLKEDDFNALMAKAEKIDYKSKIKEVADTGKKSKKAIQNSRSYIEDLKAARKEKK